MASHPSHRAAIASEFIGTYLLVLFGPAAVVAAPLLGIEVSFEALAFIAFVFAATVAAVILLFGRKSGAHINPAITVAILFRGGFDRRLFVPYVVFQTAGALLAGFSLYLAFGSLSASTNLGASHLAPGLDPVQGVFLEGLGTFILAVSALTATFFIRSPYVQAALVGATLFFLIVFIGPYTTASFNPVRSLGPSVFSSYFSNQFVYWVGPLTGGGVAGLLFRLFAKRSQT